MLSNQTLNRVSSHYRKGYHDGFDKKEPKFCLKSDELAPFGEFDYKEGYEAGKNDRYWSDKRSESS